MSWLGVGRGGKVEKGLKGDMGEREKHQKFKRWDFTSEKEEVNLLELWGRRAGGAAMGLNFQVTDVRKPLLAVKRITEKGNVVRGE